MKYGVCGGPELARVAKVTGYDYFEWSVSGLLHPKEPESVFEAALAEVRAVGLPCQTVNIFLPPDFKVTGPDYHPANLETYVTTAFKRAEKAGVERIVFGSGAARRVPDGFSHTRARQQIIEFCKLMAPFARHFGITIAVEPLNKSETNILTTVSETAEVIREVNDKSIRLLVDGYHWALDGDSSQSILDNADLLAHAHIATVKGCRPPHPGDDCAPFLNTLKQAGYHGRLSIEGTIDSPEKELPTALKCMKNILE